MAGHWIEWEKGLTRKPEVISIAREMGVDTLHAASACMLVWEWAEDVTITGHIAGVSASDVSSAICVRGIGEAMLKVGWLVQTDDGLLLPNFDRHNGQPAKKRAVDAIRKRDFRRKNAKKERP